MSKATRYTEEFKLAPIKQITERGHSVADVAQRLGVSGHSLYADRDTTRQDVFDTSKCFTPQNAAIVPVMAWLR